MAFAEDAVFPVCLGLQYTRTPDIDVTISKTPGARERRNRNWPRSVSTYDCQIGPDMQETIEQIIDFWEAVGGTECGFRLRDQSDYKSCRASQDVSVLDQVLTLIPGSPGGYQLQKTYRAGSRAQVRPIFKPVLGTVQIADNGVVKTEHTDWSLDYTTGLLSIFFSPTGQVTAGFEFDTPVRFNSQLPLQFTNWKIQQVSFQLMELPAPNDEEQD